MAKSNLEKTVMKKIEKGLKKALKETAEDVLFEIEEAYEKTIDEFYEDYGPNNGEPWWYKRTHSTYLGSSGYEDLYDSRNFRTVGNDNYRVGINVSSDNIPGNPYKSKWRPEEGGQKRSVDKDWVFRRTFDEGIHGKKVTANLKKNRKYYESAVTSIAPMSPAPKKRMDERFAKINNQSHIDEIFSDKINKMDI